MSKVFVVGGGPSLKGFDFNSLKDVNTIAINKAALHVPNPNYFITIDYSFLGRIPKPDKKRIFASGASKFFVVNYAAGVLKDVDGRPMDVRSKKAYDLSNFDVVVRSHKAEGLSRNWKDFRSGANSGHCGLQLATLLGYDQVYLLGMDMTISGNETHYHGGYGHHGPARMNKLLGDYLKDMKSGLKNAGCEIFSCSKTSKLNDLIPYISAEEALQSS